MQIAVHPNVYKTSHISGLLQALEYAWVRGHTPGDGTFYLVSGFANYNGGIRFYDVFKRHIQSGGNVTAILSGSTRQKLTSRQVVTELLKCGVNVKIINRKRLMHVKCYGLRASQGQRLVISSGNFTGPGMSQNVEMSVYIDEHETSKNNFSWGNLIDNITCQNWNTYQLDNSCPDNPGWSLLYDEQDKSIILDDTDEVSMVIILGHSDTARIMALPGSTEGKGTQYFWLSKDCFDFFPPLTTLNSRGKKHTYSCLVNIDYIDLNITQQSRVTYEAENNQDFRLGTGPLKYTQIAQQGDMAVISRISEKRYELRIVSKNSIIYELLVPYAINHIGHQGKKYGFLPNQHLFNLIS